MPQGVYASKIVFANKQKFGYTIIMSVGVEIKPVIKEYIWGREIWYQMPPVSNCILVKKIETHDKLSVQVHPNNEYAFNNENGSPGKTEVWLITKAIDGAGVYYGFNKEYTKKEIEAHIENGTLENTLNFCKVKRGDIFLVEAGTVHAIGAGIELLETQQNSDITYRLYDYNRLDKNKKKRQLHINKALDVINLKPTQIPKAIEFTSLSDKTASRQVCRIKEFSVLEYFIEEKMGINLAPNVSAIVYFNFGTGEIFANNQTFYYKQGDVFLFDQEIKNYTIIPKTKSQIIVSKSSCV